MNSNQNMTLQDICMPGMSGLDATQMFREYERRNRLPQCRGRRQKKLECRLSATNRSSIYCRGVWNGFFSPKSCPSDFLRTVEAVLASPLRFVSLYATDLTVVEERGKLLNERMQQNSTSSADESM